MQKMKLRIQALFKGSFVKNVSVLVGGTAFAQLIALLALPILTRLYSPEDFGVLAVYSSLLALISVVACLRFEIAIPIPKKDEDAAALLLLSLSSVVLMTLLTITGVIFFSDQIEQATEGKLTGYLWLIPIGVFFSGMYAALQYWATRHKAFALVAKTRMTQAVSGSATQLGFGFFGFAPFGLLVGQLLSAGAGVFGLGSYFIKNSLSIFKKVDLKGIKLVFKQYDRFPKYSTWEAFANSGAIQIPVILIAYYAVSAEAGFLMLAMRLLAAPMGLIGGAVAQVYLAEAADKNHEGLLKEFTHKTIWTLLKVGIPPLLFAGLTAPFIIPLIFGAEWQRTGILISWMVPWFLMQFVISPVSMALHIKNSQKTAMMLQFFGLILRVSSVFFTAIYFNKYIAEVYAVTGFVFYFLYLFLVLLVLNKKQ